MYFGADMMLQSTAATLDVAKMREIKDIILGKYAIKRCAQDRNALWEKCKKSHWAKVQKLALQQIDEVTSPHHFIIYVLITILLPISYALTNYILNLFIISQNTIHT